MRNFNFSYYFHRADIGEHIVKMLKKILAWLWFPESTAGHAKDYTHAGQDYSDDVRLAEEEVYKQHSILMRNMGRDTEKAFSAHKKRRAAEKKLAQLKKHQRKYFGSEK